MDKIARKELSQAIGSGNSKRLEEIIAEGIDLEVILERLGRPAYRPLGLAAYVSELNAVKILLAAGADPNGVCADGIFTPLMHAAINGKKRDVKIAAELIAAGADVNQVGMSVNGKPSVTALSRAAEHACPEFVELLIEHGADVDFMLSRGTALMKAASKNKLDNVKAMIAGGADPALRMPGEHPAKAGLNALEIARNDKAKKVVAYLEELMGASSSEERIKQNSKAGVTKAPVVKASWQRIQAALDAKRRELLSSFGRAASEKQIESAETKLGVKFPSDFRSFLRMHNGQREPLPLVPGDDGDEFGYSLLPLKDIVAEWKTWKELLDDGEFQESDASGDEGVRDTWWHQKWIPITTDGGGNHHCLDLSPAKGGKKGQVILVQHDDGSRDRVALSFAHWLGELADCLPSEK